MSGRSTQCCGGPIEMLFPARSNSIAARRVEQLSQCSSRVVTLCPLCLANLRRVAPSGVDIQDVSEYLVRAYAPSRTPPAEVAVTEATPSAPEDAIPVVS